MSDDDWDTDPDFKNDLTEAEKRAYGNRETMEMYQKATGGHGGVVGAQTGALNAPATPAPKMGEVINDAEPVGLAPTPRAEYAAPASQSPSSTPSGPLPSMMKKESSRRAPFGAAIALTPAHSVERVETERPAPTRRGASGHGVFDRPKAMSEAELQELRTVFGTFDTDSSGSITVDELSAAMAKMGTPMDRGKLVAMVGDADADASGCIDFDEFVKVVERSKDGTAATDGFGEVINKQKATVMQIKKDAIVHSFAEEECLAFADFINTKLGSDPELAYLLPIRELTELFSVVADGVLLCRLINIAEPEAIDDRVINLNPRNKFHVVENLNLAINAAKSIGITVVNIGSSDIQEGRPHLVLGLVWQVVKMALLANINLKANPNLIRLLEPGETLEAFLKLPPEKILLRWFNHHLEEASSAKRISNFGKDLADSEAYAVLLQQIDPAKQCNTRILQTSELLQRAAYVADNGARVGAEFKIAPDDIVKANEKLNLGFCAALFNARPGLDPPEEKVHSPAISPHLRTRALAGAHPRPPVTSGPRDARRAARRRRRRLARGARLPHVDQLSRNREVRQQPLRRRAGRHGHPAGDGQGPPGRRRLAPRQREPDDGLQADGELQLRRRPRQGPLPLLARRRPGQGHRRRQQEAHARALLAADALLAPLLFGQP
eukprot:Transcript_13501.p1 GENE.Transcript_13501~~Transcript_13501.p1  ORF type:complete len:700 (-),score=271.86 Transcript_13501:500-2500(-)